MPEETERCRILIADDDAPLRRLIVTAVRRDDVDVEAVANGVEVIERLVAGGPWTALLLDLMMPGMSGWDVIEWLAANREHLPRSVIVVSAADRAVLQQLDPAIVNAIIFKPFDVFQVGAYVKAACDLGADDRRQRRIVAETRLAPDA